MTVHHSGQLADEIAYLAVAQAIRRIARERGWRVEPLLRARRRVVRRAGAHPEIHHGPTFGVILHTATDPPRRLEFDAEFRWEGAWEAGAGEASILDFFRAIQPHCQSLTVQVGGRSVDLSA